MFKKVKENVTMVWEKKNGRYRKDTKTQGKKTIK